MNDVKVLCELTLQVPAPPLPDAAQALAAARRSAARRTRLAAAGSAGMALSAAATAALLATAAPGGPSAAAPTQHLATASASLPAPPPSLPAAAPDQAAIQAYGDAVLALLVAATPAGYTPTKLYDEPTSTWTVLDQPGPGYALLTPVLVTAGQRQGQLGVFVSADGKPAPTGALCSTETTEHLYERTRDQAGPCQVVTVGGVAIRVVTVQDPELGQVLTATRFLQDGVVQVIAQQGTAVETDDGQLPADALRRRSSTSAHHPPLADQPFTAQDVATLAANPALVP